MKSPFGSRGAILAHFHWTWDYLLWGIKWPVVQRMLADGPDYGSKDKKESDHEDLMAKINAIKRG
ncbi:hypothetical protein [Dyadobacter chenhuakuii]|uniref:Uncharacterized protein n=1 Tax=Dyadobacter chenhuakuii TaxID=2909339 RepID=A0A9X1QAR9_9BACT|nr:hypothetical protein [Dyadobacter chenhuakuii]MCF2498403.1 hypothetical protein [Dyadobacter chenhuakuii]